MARWPAYAFGVDCHGHWLFSPKGTIYQGQRGSTVSECEVGQGDGDAGAAVMHLIPMDAWWVAAWSRDSDYPIAVDICTPPILVAGEWSFTDLELDLALLPDGRVVLYDEDEFLESCDTGLISAEEDAHASSAALEVERALRDPSEPFGRVGWEKLEEAVKMGLPSIKEINRAPPMP